MNQKEKVKLSEIIAKMGAQIGSIEREKAYNMMEDRLNELKALRWGK